MSAVGSGGQIHLTLPEPPSSNRWWRNVNGRMVTSKEARVYKTGVASRCLTLGLHPLDGNVSIEVTWFRGRKSGDLDKRLGVLLDALQGSLYHNDSQVVRILAQRQEDKANPRVLVLVRAA